MLPDARRLMAVDRLRDLLQRRNALLALRNRERAARMERFDDLAQIHDRDAVGDVLDDGEVVGDEEVGQAELALQVLSRLMTCAWIETSSAETGSSQTMSFGAASASARAMPMRWRWPPENSCG
jgi:predicted exporter